MNKITDLEYAAPEQCTHCGSKNIIKFNDELEQGDLNAWECNDCGKVLAED